MPKVAIYLRCSTKLQEIENQRRDLLGYIENRGWELFREYSDVGFSGVDAKRPGLEELMADAKKRRFDTLLVWRFDRFARSTKHLIEALYEFKNLGINFVSYQEGIDMNSPMGEAMFTIISAIAQLERDIIRERIRSGLRRARAQGKIIGRPPKELNLEEIKRLRFEEKLPLRKIAEELGISKSRLGIILKRGLVGF